MGVEQNASIMSTAMEELLAEVYQRLEECPSPDAEWQSVREVLDDELLTGLLTIARCRCAAMRHCLDLIATRLHWLALVILVLAQSASFGMVAS